MNWNISRVPARCGYSEEQEVSGEEYRSRIVESGAWLAALIVVIALTAVISCAENCGG